MIFSVSRAPKAGLDPTRQGVFCHRWRIEPRRMSTTVPTVSVSSVITTKPHSETAGIGLPP